MISIVLFLLIILMLSVFLGWNALSSKTGRTRKIMVSIAILVGMISALFFFVGLFHADKEYYEQIDPIDASYTPFSYKHTTTLLIFAVLSAFGQVVLLTKGRNQPPLFFVINLSLMFIGVMLSLVTLMQTSGGGSKLDELELSDIKILFYAFPISYIVNSVLIGIGLIKDEISVASTRTYKNRTLEKLNQHMANLALSPMWAIIILIPILLIAIGVLVLFGQDPLALGKVFTETTTWRFSTKTHPPFLDHQGHYLCTIAVCGNPQVVKPLRLGIRHGNEIVVNRQLLVSNAFEEWIQETMPRLHRIIRRNYDRYGYPLSKKITQPWQANAVYLAMKPLEYLFTIILYLFTCEPEERIARQYRL